MDSAPLAGYGCWIMNGLTDYLATGSHLLWLVDKEKALPFAR